MQIVYVCAGPNFTVDVLILGAGIFFIKSDPEKIICLAADPGKIIFLWPRTPEIYFCAALLLSFGCRFQRVLSLEGPVFVFGRSYLIASKGFCFWKVLFCSFQTVFVFGRSCFVFAKSCLVASNVFCLWDVLSSRLQWNLSLECLVWLLPKGFVFGRSRFVAYKGNFCLWKVWFCCFHKVLSLEGLALSLPEGFVFGRSC